MPAKLSPFGASQLVNLRNSMQVVSEKQEYIKEMEQRKPLTLLVW